MPLTSRQKARKRQALRREQARIRQQEREEAERPRWINIHRDLSADVIKLIINCTPAKLIHHWLRVASWTRVEVIKTVQEGKTRREYYIKNLQPLGQNRCSSCNIASGYERFCSKCDATYPFLDTAKRSYANFTTKCDDYRDRTVEISVPWFGPQNRYEIKIGFADHYWDDANDMEYWTWKYYKFTMEPIENEWVARWIKYELDSDDPDYYDTTERCINNYCLRCLDRETMKLFRVPVKIRLEGELEKLCDRCKRS